MNFKRKRTVLLQNGDTVRNQVKHLLIILIILISFLLFSSPVIGQETGVLYLWENGTKYMGEWKYGEKHGQGTFTWPDEGKYKG